MYNLIRFIQKHNFILLFLLLEVVCMVLLMTSQGFHKQIIVNQTNDVVGKLYETGSNVSEYFHLRSINRKLADENAMLRQQLAVSIDTSSTGCVLSNEADHDTLYRYISARVVNNSINQVNNYITINKGRMDGIKKDMGVISSDGIVGVVSDVSSHYATVLSLLHSYSVTSVRFKNNQHLANLKWGTNNFRYGTIEDIPTHILLKTGDTVVTSCYSYIFPEDLMVGTIQKVIVSPTGDLNKAKIKFATNFSTLRQVFVIENKARPELDSLTQRLPDI